MSTVDIKYVGSPALFYNDEGENIFRSTITEYDKKENSITVEELPPDIKVGGSCKLLILTNPVPQECLGRIKNDAGKLVIAIYKGHEKEQRGSVRYKVDFLGSIEKLIYDRSSYDLLSPVVVKILNLSSTGMRINAKPYTILNGDRFLIRIFVNVDVKIMVAQVMNSKEVDSENAEYGCRFLTISGVK